MAQAAAGAQRRRYPLAVHISTLFVVLLLVAGLAIGGLAYFRSVAMLTRAADDLFDRVARETTHEVQRIATPGEALLDVLAQTRIATAGNLAERLDTLALVREGFAVSPNISAIYAGYATGDFFLVRRVPDAPEARRRSARPSAPRTWSRASSVAGRNEASAPSSGSTPISCVSAIESRPEYTAFDPRTRPWYLDASNAADQIKTAPYVFFTTHEVGVTLARRAAGLKSVVGMDITLQAIRAALARQRITPGTEIALADADGHVIAHPDAARVLLPGPPGQAPARAALAEVGSPVLAALAGRLPDAGKQAQIAEIDAGGRAWRTLVAPLALAGHRDSLRGSSSPCRSTSCSSKRAGSRATRALPSRWCWRRRSARGTRRGERDLPPAAPARGRGERDPALRVLAAGGGGLDREGGRRARRDDGRDEAHDPPVPRHERRGRRRAGPGSPDAAPPRRDDRRGGRTGWRALSRRGRRRDPHPGGGADRRRRDRRRDPAADRSRA